MNRDVLQNENCNFRISLGTRCEKNGACSRISTRKFVWTAFFANKFFVSRSDFREVNPVVRLVQSSGSVGSLRSNGFASSFFFASRCGLRWCSVDRRLLDFGERHAGWFLNLLQQYIAVDSFRSGNGLHFAFCGQEEQRTNSPSEGMMSPSSWEGRWRREKCENFPPQPSKKPSKTADHKQCKLRGEVDRPVNTSHTPSAARANDINSPRTETSIFDLQNDATVRRTVTTFVWPQTQFHENLHTNFVLQNLPNTSGYFLLFPAYSWIDGAWWALTWGMFEFPGWNVVVYSNNYKLEKKKDVLSHLRMLAPPPYISNYRIFVSKVRVPNHRN